MRKFFFIFMLCFTNLAFAQDASISETFGITLDWYAQQFDGQKYLIMKGTSKVENVIPIETTLKIKFMNGEVRHWKGNCVNISSKTNSKTFISETKVEEETIKILRFDLTDDDIFLFKSGVEKVTLYTVPEVYRKVFPKDKIGFKLYEAFKKVEEEF